MTTCSLQNGHVRSDSGARAGVTIGMLSGDVRKVLSAITGIAQDHYPETMKRTIIINAPMSFRFVFAVVKPLLQPRTVNKITLLGTKYMDDLAKSVDPKNIPTYLGGGCKATLLEDPGPWNDEQALLTLRQIEEQPYSEGWGEMSAEPARGEAHTKAASDVKSDVVAESPPLVRRCATFAFAMCAPAWHDASGSSGTRLVCAGGLALAARPGASGARGHGRGNAALEAACDACVGKCASAPGRAD